LFVVTEYSKYAIETVSLTKIFPDWWGRAKVVAVSDLELKVNHNEVYGLLGPNGSGKTTTLKMLLNLLHPTKGMTFLLGGNCSDPKLTARIGYLPEDSYLYKYLSARETLDFYGRIFGLPARVRKSRIDELLELVGLTGIGNRAVGTFSKGMARRIGLAQALINDPQLLILDEPTSGMDPIGTRQMKDLFLQLAKRGKTILLCSHLLADVEDVCDRIGILYGGKMQVEGTVESLLKHTDETQIVTEGISDSAIEQIKRIIESERASCEITSPMDKLEEFFIRTVAKAQEQHLPTSGAVSTMKITGFLSEEESAAGILDELVSAHPTEAESIETVETRKISEDVPARHADTGLLETLTKTKIEYATTDAVDDDEQEQLLQAPTEDVKHDILEQLTRNDQGGDGLTETVDPDKAGENEDA
jgi:ABC-2 type transport system ATP-binding protein